MVGLEETCLEPKLAGIGGHAQLELGQRQNRHIPARVNDAPSWFEIGRRA